MNKKQTKHNKINLKEVTTEFVLFDKDGNIKDKRSYHNLITNVGHAAANGRMSNQGSYNPFIYLAIGTGTTAAAATDTALQTEITTGGGARASATATQVTTSVTNDTTQLVHTWTFTSTFAVTEEGILDAALAGNLLAHQVFTAINVNSGDSLQVTHKYQT